MANNIEEEVKFFTDILREVNALGKNQHLLNINELQRKIWALPEHVLPYTLYRYIIFVWKKIKLIGKEWPYQEEYFLKWRPFSKEKYYIIRAEYPVYAHFAAARSFIFAAEYAKQRRMYPIIVLQWRSEIKNRELCGENVWESIFRQKKIQDIQDRNATILVSKVDPFSDMHSAQTCIDINNDLTDRNIHAKEENWRDYYKNAFKYAKKYWKFERHIINETNKMFIDMFRYSGNILGVALRENFSSEYYESIKNMDVRRVYRRHPQGPDISEILDMVADYLRRWDCNKIFVASVYKESIKRFEERFPNKVIYCERERMTISESLNQINCRKKFIDDNLMSNQEWKAQSCRTAKEYVEETILLSKCTYLIGAKSGQTIAALTLNGGRYKDIKVLEDKRQIERY